MKIDYVLIGSNNDILYIDFWPLISKVWKLNFGIEPILGFISNDEYVLKNEYGEIKRFPVIKNVDVGLQSQIIRIFLAKFFDGVCLISDIDMLPISKKYFQNLANYIDNNNFLIASSDHAPSLKNQMYPMCYILGHARMYQKIFDLNLDWENFCNLINSDNHGWFSDQKYIYRKINQFNSKNKNCVFLNRGWDDYGNAIARIDRTNWTYDFEKIKSNYYIDSHLLRPYKQNANTINSLLNRLDFV